MYSATPILRTIGLNSVVPGVAFVIIASFLLCWWELRRLTGTENPAAEWWLPHAAIAAGIISFALIAVRFIGVA